MGRPVVTQPPVPAGFVQECFDIRVSHEGADIHVGELVWRERPREHFPCRPEDHAHFNALHAGRPAGFRGPGGKLLVRFQWQGRTRRMALLRAAWIVTTGVYPDGPLKV